MPGKLRVLALAAALAAGVPLAGCSGPAPATAARSVEVRIAASEHPVAYEVQVAQAAGDYRSVHRMRTGDTRSFAVPAGWLTVRIPGLCVVPAADGGEATTVVEVDGADCRLR